MAKKVFKRHQFGQIMLLPPSLDEMIENNHPVRIVSQIIDQIDITPLEKKCPCTLSRLPRKQSSKLLKKSIKP